MTPNVHRSRAGRAAEFIDRSGMGPVLRRLPLWHGVLVLTYHRILADPSQLLDPGVWSGTPEVLDAQLDYLCRNADVIAPDDLPEVLRPQCHPGRHVMLTFDDGYRDNYEQAFPVLHSHFVRAAFFLVTGLLDESKTPWWDEVAWMVRHASRDELRSGWAEPLSLRSEQERDHARQKLLCLYKGLAGDDTERFLDDVAEGTGAGRAPRAVAEGLMMTWEMARTMQARGMSIGGHTAHHPVLARLTPEEQRREVDECAERLRDELGQPARLFSYPVGLPDAFDAETRSAVRAAGFDWAFSLSGGVADPHDLDPYDVPRVSVAADTEPAAFRAKLMLPRLFARW